MKRDRFKTTKNGYIFDRRIFQSVIIILLAFFIIFALDEGIDNNVYVECPPDVFMCLNPLYENCDAFESYSYKINQDESIVSAKYLCKQEFLLAGTIVGEKPKLIYKFAPAIFILIAGLGFVFNHLKYNWRKKE